MTNMKQVVRNLISFWIEVLLSELVKIMNWDFSINIYMELLIGTVLLM